MFNSTKINVYSEYTPNRYEIDKMYISISPNDPNVKV
jgi:hypothetical protein